MRAICSNSGCRPCGGFAGRQWNRDARQADLLVVDANPLTDIRNTRRVHAVVANGRLVSRAGRERTLADDAADTAVCCVPLRK
jgi:hypothetical protein